MDYKTTYPIFQEMGSQLESVWSRPFIIYWLSEWVHYSVKVYRCSTNYCKWPIWKILWNRGDDGIRKLLELVSEEYHIINIYATEDPNILRHTESSFIACNGVGTDCSESDSDFENASECPVYDSEELESRQLKRKWIFQIVFMSTKSYLRVCPSKTCLKQGSV